MLTAVLVAAVLQTTVAAGAAPSGVIYYQGHGYELVDAKLYQSWDDANAAAVAMPTWPRRCAHLATITSEGEQAVLTALMEGSTRNAWIGGFQPAGELSLDQGWQWVTGEAWSYTNWDVGEPNDTPGTPPATPGSEQYLEAYPGGVWNDAPSPEFEGGEKYFVVEYERCRRLPVEIVVDELLPIEIPDPGQPFTATGPAVLNGYLCAEGDVFDTAWTSRPGLGFTRLRVTKQFVCDDGTGTFEVKMRVKLYPDQTTTARWRVTNGTGSYTTLRGRGTLVGTPFTGGITDIYTGMVKR